MKSRDSRRSVCPVSCTLDLIGDKWTMLVIRDLFLGRRYFSEFCSSPEGIATNILSNRLSRLVESGLVEKTSSGGKKGRDSYQLTEKGESLQPVLRALADWGIEHVPGTKRALKPLKRDQ